MIKYLAEREEKKEYLANFCAAEAEGQKNNERVTTMTNTLKPERHK